MTIVNGFGMWRKTLNVGEWQLAWTSQLHLSSIFWRDSQDNDVTTEVVTDSLQFDWTRNGAWIKAPATPGTYKLIANGADTGRTVTVREAPLARARVEVAVGEDWAPHLATPNTEVVLAPGRHHPAGDYHCAENVGISADVAGTVVVVIGENETSINRLIKPGDDTSISRIDFEGSGYLIYGDFIDPQNIKITECTLRGGAVIGEHFGAGAYVSRCKFYNNVWYLHGHMFFEDCDFLGFECEVSVWGGDCFAMRRCRWNNTRRGIYFFSFRGHNTNHYFSSISFQDIAWEVNGQECFMDEGGFLKYCAAVNMKFVDCDGPAIMLWGGESSYNRFTNVMSLGSGGLTMTADNMGHDNQFYYCEFHNRGTIAIRSGRDNYFVDCAVVNPQPSRYNQYTWTHEQTVYEMPFAYEMTNPNQFVRCVAQSVRPDRVVSGPAVELIPFLVNTPPMAA